VPDAAPTFASLAGVHPRTAATLERAGFTSAFPVQAAVIPEGIKGRDLLVKSPTGSGKTIAFGVPMIEQLKAGLAAPHALVLVPTRELAVQVTDDLAPIAMGKQLRIAAVYGGASIVAQARACSRAAIVVATPGRLADLMRQRKIDLANVRMLVLDEADRMLDMGFQPQVDEIVDTLPKGRQTMLFSATLDGAVGKVASSYTKDPHVVETTLVPGAGGSIEHVMLATTSGTKVDSVLDALDDETRDLAVVFVRTKRSADKLCERLRDFGHRSTAIHGDMSQGQRLREYRRFQNADATVLVATDVFARGMDLDRITHVINYDLPEDADTYRHRTGRTGRAGRGGTAITMVMPSQKRTMKRLLIDAGLAPDLLDTMRRTSKTQWNAVPSDQRYVPGNVKMPRAEREEHGDGSRPARFDRQGGNAGRGGARREERPRAAGEPRHQIPGTVVRYDTTKGFGFITPDGGGSDVFFHRSTLVGIAEDRLRKGLKVEFGAEQHTQGVRAGSVRIAGRAAAARPNKPAAGKATPRPGKWNRHSTGPKSSTRTNDKHRPRKPARAKPR
jgi:superfamily II DNA/RNA helicase